MRRELTRKQKIAATIGVGFHLILVVGGAASFDTQKIPFAGRALAAYGALSGAGSGYGFFAPGVGTQLRATFVVNDGKKTFADTLGGEAHRELDLRVGNFVTAFWDYEKDEKARRAISGSWAGKIFSRHADAKEVTVRLEAYELPTAEEYAAGARPSWEPYYEAKFAYQRTP